MTVLRAARLTLSLLLSALSVILGPATSARADQYLVEPGQTWDTLGPKLKAGDEVLLKPGKHRPAVFTAVSGAPLTPIVIRCSEAGKLAEIAPDREALKLTDCKHIRIQGLQITNARRAGILIESTSRLASRDIAIHDVVIKGVKGLAEESGIVARDVSALDIRRCRIENCAQRGVLIENCENLTIAFAQLLAIKSSPMKTAVALLGRVSSASIESVLVLGSIDTAFSIGTTDVAPAALIESAESTASPAASPAAIGASHSNATHASPASLVTPTEPAAQPLVRFLSISECRCARALRFLEVGSCADATVRNCTISEPHEEVYAVVAAPPSWAATSIVMHNCLIEWTPGGLRRLGHIADGADGTGFILGDNLWFSKEIPLALELLGPKDAPFPGTVSVPQRMDINPRLSEVFYPLAAEAEGFGARKP